MPIRVDHRDRQALRDAQAVQRESFKQVLPMLVGLVILGLGSGGVGLVVAFFDKTRTITETRTSTSGHLWWKETTTVDVPVRVVDVPIQTRLMYLLSGIGLLLLAVLCIAIVVWIFATRQRLKRYPPILKGHEAMSIERIVDITGSSRATVVRDLRTLISTNAISDVYIDYDAGQVVNKKYVPEASSKTVVKCSECGGNNELIVGIPKSCGYCGQLVLAGTS